jgi:hypothetical protein
MLSDFTEDALLPPQEPLPHIEHYRHEANAEWRYRVAGGVNASRFRRRA